MRRWGWVEHAVSYETEGHHYGRTIYVSRPIAGFTRPLPYPVRRRRRWFRR